MIKEVLKKDDIPDGVSNVAAYRRFKEEHAKVMNDPSRYYDAKNGNYTFDFNVPFSTLLNQLVKYDIPDGECESIKVKAKNWIKKRSSLLKYRVAAFKGSMYLGQVALLDSKKSELIGLFGRLHTISEVHKIVTVDWEMSDITYSTIERFRHNNIELIQAEQDKYIKDWSGLRLVYKKSRLDEYANLYEGRKQRYEETKGRDDYRLLLQTLEAIRREIEGDRLTVDGALEINIQNTINIHIQQDVLRNINILQFIISRVAVKMNIDPVFLMTRLEKSHYAKFTGFAEPDNNRMTDEIKYPSRELYDFNKIRTQEVEVIESKPLPEVKEEIKQVGNSLLDALLKRKKELIESEQRVLEQGKGTSKPSQKRHLVNKKGKNSGKK